MAADAFGTGAHVTAHVVGGELGMELHAPRLAAEAERMAVVLRRARQDGRPLRCAQHGLQVGGVGREALGQAGEQRVAAGRGIQCQFDGARLATGRVVGHLAAEGVGEQLVAVADAEHRALVMDHPAQPLRAALAPVGAVGDIGSRAGDDHPGEVPVVGQGAAVFDIDHHGLVGLQPGGHPDPMRKPPVAAQRGDGLAGFKNQERGGIHPGAAALTGLPRL
ncbi:hypothetical protein D3C71_1366740 [compost metagenome]